MNLRFLQLVVECRKCLRNRHFLEKGDARDLEDFVEVPLGPEFLGYAFSRKSRRIMPEMPEQVEIENGHNRSQVVEHHAFATKSCLLNRTVVMWDISSEHGTMSAGGSFRCMNSPTQRRNLGRLAHLPSNPFTRYNATGLSHRVTTLSVLYTLSRIAVQVVAHSD